MISRTTIIGVVGAIVVIAAILLNYFMSEEAPSEPVAAIPEATGSGGDAKPSRFGIKRSGPAATVSKPQAAGEKTDVDSPGANPGADDNAVQPEITGPVFDVVRVDPEGNTVIAGRAQPNTKVQIRDGDKVIGEVISDGRGDWVFVPEARLAPGSRVLTLSTGKDGEKASNSKNAVVLVIPEPGKDIAGAKGGGDRTPLAMVVPRDQASGAPSRVIQAPVAAAGAPAEASSAPTEKTVTASALPSTEAQTNNGGVRTFPEPATEGAGNSGDPSKAVADAHPPVSLDTIDYDDKGGVVFSGKAKPGDTVQVYVDNRLAGTATTDAEGRWTILPTTGLQPGTHQIRVDQVAEKGAVLARIELPFVRAQPFTSLPNQSVVIIQPGNNLWRIAARVYGDGLRYTDIFQANADQIRNPDLIYPGQVFGLPRTN